MRKEIRDLLKDIWSQLGWRYIYLILLIILYGAIEGIGLSLLFPLLRYLGIKEGGDVGSLAGLVDKGFAIIGVKPQLVSVLLLITGTFGFQHLVFLLRSWFSAKLQTEFTKNWRTRLFRQVISCEWNYFTKRRAADIINALMRECDRLNLAFYNLVDLTASTILIFFYILLAFLTSWKAAIFLSSLGIVVYRLTRPIMRRSVCVGHKITAANEALMRSTYEFLRGAKLIKATAADDMVGAHYDLHAERAAELTRHVVFQPALLRVAFEFSGIIGLVTMIGVGIDILEADPAAIIIVIYLFMRLHSRISSVQQNANNINFYLAGHIAVQNAYLDALSMQEKDIGEEKLNLRSGPEIVLDNVSVKQEEQTVLHNVNMRISQGEMVALVGHSGSGKSTLVDVIIGLIKPYSGQVIISGMPLKEISLKSWRHSLGYVAQETFLFNNSFTENVRWSKQDATPKEIRAAAIKAHAHQFIIKTSHGYETNIGDSGLRLSGGQRQRIGLARALLSDYKLLILDEATSALDSEAERMIMEEIDDLRGERTIIVIAHRLSTIRNVDKIYVLDEGHIIESGSWVELMSKDSRFKEMWHMQINQTSSPQSALS